MLYPNPGVALLHTAREATTGAPLPNPPRFCYVALLMTLLHENLPQAIEDLSARIIAIRDSL